MGKGRARRGHSAAMTENRIAGQGVDIRAGLPEQLTAFIRQELAKCSAVIDSAGVRAD